MTHEIRRGERSYELLVDGVIVAIADYADNGMTVELPHVETKPGFRDRGLASELLGGVLERLRADGRRVRPLCPFAAAYVREHPEFAGLL